MDNSGLQLSTKSPVPAPDHPLVRAVVGPPYWGVRRAVRVYFDVPEHVELVEEAGRPFIELALTAREYAGWGFFASAAPGAGSDARLRRALEVVERVDEERRERHRAEVERRTVLHERGLHPRPGLTVQQKGESMEAFRERVRSAEPVPVRLTTVAPESALDDFLAGLSAAYLDLVRAAVRRFEEEVRGEDEFWQAQAFKRWRNGEPEAVAILEELTGGRSPGGRILHPAAAGYFTEVRKALAGLVKERPESRALRPQERDHLDAVEAKPAIFAALFAWDRAGRPGALTTFAKRVGVNLTASEADAVDPGGALVGGYRAG